ncbi:TniQ family protein [Nocardia sp. bgisy134]|uniref:TniQ family protein n=1 Tax=unclassified Nocardia TaxID=2637762 RepID=UPI003D728BB5
MPTAEPLGRSLLPLPDESLPGFVLRLSYRINQSPARLMEVTGLATERRSGVFSTVGLLTEIPEPSRQTFAHTTRLPIEAVTQLGLNGLRGRYPLPSTTTDIAASGVQALNTPWFLTPATRYCPECLAGDGTPIQQAFGGAWRRAWRLPVVFACTKHQRLLEHRCPECDQLVHDRRPGRHGLLPAMGVMLHPAQCRQVLNLRNGRAHDTCCGTRLDRPRLRRSAGPELVALQDKILGLLEFEGPASTLSVGHLTEPISYFADLQAVTMLATQTWPALRHMSPSEETATSIDEHVTTLLRRAADRSAKTPSVRPRTIFGPPPADAAARAALTYIADRILLSGNAETVREYLRPLLPATTSRAGKTARAQRLLRSQTPLSTGMQAACEPLLRGFAKAGGSRGRRAASVRPQHWGPEHIPAFLPKSWYERHFEAPADVNPMFTRRTAALKLVQMVAGGSLGEAAEYLGLGTGHNTELLHNGRIYSGAHRVHVSVKQQPDPLGFESALTALAAELDEPATLLVNYQSRRRALETWFIDTGTWNDLILRLPPDHRSRPEPELIDRKRQLASIYVWVQLTNGEHLFAPQPIRVTQPPEIQQAWKRQLTSSWHHMHSHRCGPYYSTLKAELDSLATTLAHKIDSPAG